MIPTPAPPAPIIPLPQLGQLFSSRGDVLPREFTEELSQLQDRVPAFSADAAEAAIALELGAPPAALFRTFDRVPLAAASLGQVHRAVLPTGEQVVVKVQRPGLAALFDVDLAALGKIAARLDADEEAVATGRDFTGIFAECAAVLRAEIDYFREGGSADRFRRDFRQVPWVKVPVVHWRYTSLRVLTLEYVPGIKVSDGEALRGVGLAPKAVASRAIECYLQQILRTGFIHADPHPGNISVSPVDGALIYYDFGMMCELAPFTRERLLEAFYAVYEKDAGKVLATLQTLGVIQLTRGDGLSVRRAIQFFLNTLDRKVEQREALASIGEDLFSIALDQPFRFPATFTFVLRSFTTLEGVGKGLDPDFSFARVAAPYAQELLDVRTARGRGGLVLAEVSRQASDFSAAVAAVPSRVGRMEATLAAMESGELRLRVRVLEAERAARRASVLQVATLQAIAACSLAQLAVSLSATGAGAPGGVVAALGVASAAFGGGLAWSLRRVRRLDAFEANIRAGPPNTPQAAAGASAGATARRPDASTAGSP